MRNKQYLLLALFTVMLTSCYHEVDLDEYRDKDGEKNSYHQFLGLSGFFIAGVGDKDLFLFRQT